MPLHANYFLSFKFENIWTNHFSTYMPNIVEEDSYAEWLVIKDRILHIYLHITKIVYSIRELLN